VLNTEVIQRWVDALESGDYKQGDGALSRKLNNGHRRYCCLGVLCELAVEEGVISESRPVPEYPNSFQYGLDGNLSTLPAEVRDWAGLDSGNPNLKYDHENENEAQDDMTSCVSMNDSYGVDFPGIAQAIRDTFLKDV
jgi:hypothetical protein